MQPRIAACLLLLIGVSLTAPVWAQGSQKPARIGLLSPFDGSRDAFRDAFRQRLTELGYGVGRNIIIEYRASGGMADRLQPLARELVQLKVDAIVTATAAGAQAARQASATIPIVIAGVDDAVEQGFVVSLAKPGGNVTGVSWLNTELTAKRVELLKQTLPNVARIAYLREALGAGSSLRAAESAARTLGVRLAVMEVRSPVELDSVFAALARERVGAVMVAQSAMLAGEQARVIALAAKFRLPTIFAFRDAVEGGALMSYGPKPTELYRRAADYADRIIRGAKPAELPVEQPTSFELVINVKTAAALGVRFPQTILVSADDAVR